MWDQDVERVTSQPLSALRVKLQRLRRQRGEPSLREIATRARHAISHATVRTVLTGDGLPRWGQIEVIVEALDGDVEQFRELWVAARDQQDGTAVADEPLDERFPEVLSWDDLPQSMPELEAARSTVDHEIAEKRQRETDLARELFGAREERADRDDEIKRLQSRAAVDEARRQYLEGEIGRLETARDRLSERIQELENSLAVVHEDLAQLAREKAELAERYKDLYWEWARHGEEARAKLQRELDELRDKNRSQNYDFPLALRRAQTGLGTVNGSAVHEALQHLHAQMRTVLHEAAIPSGLALLTAMEDAAELSSQLDHQLRVAQAVLSECIAAAQS